MFYEDENTVVLTGNLTRDVETRQSPGSTLVANIRIGVNGRRKDGDQWVDKPNFFTVVTFGKSAENAKKYLAQGRRILVKGRLDWSEYDKDGETRQSVQIIAERIRYLPSKASIEAQAAQGDTQTTMVEPATERADVEPATAEPAAEPQQPVGVGVGEDDRPPF